MARLRGPFFARLKAMRSVGGFCVAAIFTSAFLWLSDSALRFLALAPLGSDAASVVPISLLTYAFVHPQPLFLFWSIISLGIVGLILEPRIGSRPTLFTILGGILVPGIFWIVFGESGALIIGSSGIFYAIVGGFLAVWQRQWARLVLPERILTVIVVAWAALEAISATVSPFTNWTPFTGVPVGYGIALILGPTSKPEDRGPAEEGIS